MAEFCFSQQLKISIDSAAIINFKRYFFFKKLLDEYAQSGARRLPFLSLFI